MKRKVRKGPKVFHLALVPNNFCLNDCYTMDVDSKESYMMKSWSRAISKAIRKGSSQNSTDRTLDILCTRGLVYFIPREWRSNQTYLPCLFQWSLINSIAFAKLYHAFLDKPSQAYPISFLTLIFRIRVWHSIPTLAMVLLPEELFYLYIVIGSIGWTFVLYFVGFSLFRTLLLDFADDWNVRANFRCWPGFC